jgi:hypothetical protein
MKPKPETGFIIMNQSSRQCVAVISHFLYSWNSVEDGLLLSYQCSVCCMSNRTNSLSFLKKRQHEVLLRERQRDPFALGPLIALLMEEASTSETSVDIQLRTRQYVSEDSELHIVFQFYFELTSLITTMTCGALIRG